jgi:plasmid stabilization system protein ParE
LQWLQDTRKINRCNLNKKPADISGIKWEYLKDTINELATNTENKNIRDLCRGINGFKRDYQPRNNIVRDENGDLLVEFYNILNRWKNYFSQLLNVHNVSDVMQILHTAEPLVPGPIRLEVEIAIAELKSINRQVVIKFRQNCLKQEARYYCLRSTNSLILFGISKNCLISGRNLLLYQFTKRVRKLIVKLS